MIGKILGKRYELIEKIGEGGMGLVYKAKCHLLNRYVAVKILKPELTADEEFINKFRKESQSSASLSHPNIVNIYDVGLEDGIYYIVMEYVKGKTLKDIIKERAPMPYYEIINIGRQICLALEHAHNNGIIHRDVKPQNILITHDGIVKVADFGIARASNSSTLTNTGSVLGSVYYISPEQARGGYTDEKTDIYSLGTVMYEMAAARVPFEGESPVVVALKHIQESVVKPSVINPDIPVALEDIILKALEKNSASRYESAALMIKDLDRASQNPNSHIATKYGTTNDMTRVMPAISEADINDTAKARRKKNKKKTKWGWIAALITLVVLAAASGIFVLLTSHKGSDEVPIPTIIGQNESTAEKMLSDSGLVMKVSDRRPSNEYPEGTVIYVWPGVGTKVKKNYPVNVRISAGPEKVKVPDLTGDTMIDAKYELDGAGLKWNFIEQNNEDYDADKVFKQTPEADSEVVKGSTVDVYVSKGPEIKITKVPQLVGLQFDKLEEILKEYGLNKGDVEYDNDPSKPDNEITWQSVPQGKEIKQGETIDIRVNNTTPDTPATS